MKRIEAINDFVVKFANVNGSGSAIGQRAVRARRSCAWACRSAPRNIFPSNIQGLPTWYEVRVTEEGYLGRRGGVDLMVAMNPQTWDADVTEIEPGGYLFYDNTKPLPKSKFRDDINVIGMPLTEICNATYTDPRQRQLFKNIIYVGALSALLDIDPAEIEHLFAEQYKGKEALLQSNVKALQLGRDYALAHLECPIGLRGRSAPTPSATRFSSRATTPPRSAPSTAAPRSAPGIRSRRRLRSPRRSSSTASRYRVDPATGKNKFAIVQAEDELASIGIVIGAGWNGARAFTATSGPGISLMTEFIGLAYFAEIPAVIIDVQRGGPSTGMPTRTQQSDLLSCAYASHGDTKHVLLFPEDPNECFEFTAQAFDLADRLQTPIFVMTDLDIGMNTRLCEPLAWDDSQAYDRGKVMTYEELEAGKDFGRYLDVDGDGIAVPHLPGHASDARRLFHARHDQGPLRALQRSRPGLRRQHAAAAAQIRNRQDAGAQAAARTPAEKPARFGAIYFGSTSPAMQEALDVLAQRGHLRQRAARARLPVPGRDRRLRRRAPEGVRGRAEPRRPAEDAAGQRGQGQPGAPDVGAALRRHADHRALHRRPDLAARRGAHCRAAQERSKSAHSGR